VRTIDINASAVDAPAADQLALHQITGDAQYSAVHSWGAQLQVTNSVHLGDDVVIWELVSNGFLQTQTGYKF